MCTGYGNSSPAIENQLDGRRSTRLTIPPSSDARPLVYDSNHQALSTARFRCAGLLATADTCTLHEWFHRQHRAGWRSVYYYYYYYYYYFSPPAQSL